MKKKRAGDRYKEKQCPVCGVLHKKRWQCCSFKCGMEYRAQTLPTEEAIRARAEGVKRWKQTDKGEATNTNLKNFTQDDELVLPPTQYDNDFYIEDGDVWSPTDYK